MIIVPATISMLRDYYGDFPIPTMRAFIGLEDDKPVAVGGFVRVSQGCWALFSESKPGVRERYKLTALKFAKMLIRIADECGYTLVAEPDEHIPNSERFIRHLGFVPDTDGVFTRWSG